MPRLAKPLTVSTVKNAKPRTKPYKVADGRGLFLLVQPTGAKWWRFRYLRPDTRKANSLSLGTFPDTSLKQAREKRDALRKRLAEGIDVGVERQAPRDSFQAVAEEWFARFSPKWAKSHSSKVIRRLEKDVFPYLGQVSINTITAPQLLALARRVEKRGRLETAHRLLQNLGQVFRYAVACGYAERNPVSDLRGALPPATARHYPTIADPARIGELLRAMDSYAGEPVTCAALRLLPILFCRPGELRHMEWSELDFETAQWTIPAAKMKGRRAHIVPLSRQALAILAELHPLTGTRRYVFPGLRSRERPISDMTINAALRRLGYTREQLTAHSFRSIASTRLNEMGFPYDAIERELAHVERDKVRAAYNHAEHLAERARMMQAWAHYLDGLRAGNVVAIKRKTGAL